jgi:hypothetical protein
VWATEEELDRWREWARQARRDWARKHPAAAVAVSSIEERHGHVPHDDFELLRERDPEAASEFGRLILYSPDLIRKMRLTDPDWHPPDPGNPHERNDASTVSPQRNVGRGGWRRARVIALRVSAWVFLGAAALFLYTVTVGNLGAQETESTYPLGEFVHDLLVATAISLPGWLLLWVARNS